MTDLYEGDERHQLSDEELREMFLELAEPLPSEQLTERNRTDIRILTAVADKDAEAKREKEIQELHRMVDPAKDIR